MVDIIVDGKSHKVEDGLTIIQVCDTLGIKIPRFCYHERLPVVGNCRMCLVQVDNGGKLVPACTTSVAEGMEITIQGKSIEDARKGVIELLLVNHPLDCPICDQAGECDLQDQAYTYGLDRGRSIVPKRAVPDKQFSPLIDAFMTRCIHCTRCIRFCTEIAGTDSLGAIGRGDDTEIETYINHSVSSELSGNLVDVCPVGALTSSDYSYKVRPWELNVTNTIDLMDAVGSNTKVYSTALAVLRILPRVNDHINEEWLADKSRYITDSLRSNRLDIPMVRQNGELKPANWDKAFTTIWQKMNALSPSEVGVIAGGFSDVETMLALKELMHSLGVNKLDCRTNGVLFDVKDPSSYLFNTTIKGIEESDLCLLIGANPKVEAPILNARIRKSYLYNNLQIAVIGEDITLNYQTEHLGSNTSLLYDLLEGSHPFADKLSQAKKPMLIIGLGALIEENHQDIINLCKQIAQKYNMVQDDWCGFNVLQTSTATLSGLELGFVPPDYSSYGVSDIIREAEAGMIKMLWLSGADEALVDVTSFNRNTLVIYQGHHGDIGASLADVILPGALWFEKDATYVNLERRVQRAYQAIPRLGASKEDWRIIRQFSKYAGKPLPYDNLQELRKYCGEQHNIFRTDSAQTSHLNQAVFMPTKDNVVCNIKGVNVSSNIHNYYITDVISKNSKKMQECSNLFKKGIGYA